MKNKIMYTLVGVLCVLVVSLGVTLAYWVAGVGGTGEKITIELANNLKVILNDPTIVTETGVEPGWSTSKTFTVENQGSGNTSYNIVIKNLVNTLVSEEYLQYKITSDNGYNMEEYVSVPKANDEKEEVLAYNIEIEGKVTHSYTIEFRYIESNTNQSEDMGKMFSGNLSITEGTEDPNSKTLYNILLADNPTRLTRTDFSAVLTTENTNTLYTAEDPWTEDVDGDGVGETVYYFAGNALNNWVKFGKDSDNNDLYWRIIRTNEDKSVRLLYAGTAMNTTAGYIGSSQAYNSTYDNTMYVGYIYGTTGSLANNRTNTTSALIKTTIETWYANGLNTKTDGSYTYDSYISKTAIYCNDRATSSYSASGEMYYAAYDRLYTNKQPSYKCGNNVSGTLYETTQAVEDKFSVNTASGGNGQLTYPIALMTADEVAFAGGVYGTGAETWYYYNSINGNVTGSGFWWIMSPYYANSNNNASVFIVDGSGNLFGASVRTLNVVRPSLSLKSCVSWTSGNGSSSTPYEVQVSSTCASKEN